VRTLILRCWAVDPERCPKCGKEMKRSKALTDQHELQRLLKTRGSDSTRSDPDRRQLPYPIWTRLTTPNFPTAPQGFLCPAPVGAKGTIARSHKDGTNGKPPDPWRASGVLCCCSQRLKDPPSERRAQNCTSKPLPTIA